MNIISKLQDWFEQIKGFWTGGLSSGIDKENESYFNREKIIVFIIAFILALGMWFLVNMSRNYILDVNMPIQLGNIPDDKALASDLPESATVSLQGEGWKLISIYNDPPEIFLNVTKNEINLYEQAREQLSSRPTLTVLKVQPITANVKLEQRISKKVPVISDVSVSFGNQFDFLNGPSLNPDSVVISGAASRLQEIDSVRTEQITLNDVRNDVRTQVKLKKPYRMVELSTGEVTFEGEVAEFTEGETSVFVETRNMPTNKNVTFSPPTVTIRYYVPIHEYKKTTQQKPFEAYVDYFDIRRDSTGYVEPRVDITNNELHLKIRSYQPERISYYHVMGSSSR